MPVSTSSYISGRWDLKGLRKRPQAIAWADSAELTNDNYYIPSGNEWEDFIILSDHNRGEIGITSQRIENRQRMINGTMRSYHIADKNNFSWSWDMLPSRSYSEDPNYTSGGKLTGSASVEVFTVDGGAGGVELINWYKTHPNSFYMLLSYDRYDIFPSGSVQYEHLAQYNIVHEVFFSSFDHSVVKRAGLNFDFWNISVSLEEV
jgi:hypothetical protein